MKNGKGFIREFNKKDILEFEGEYLNGVRHGKGKEYYENGKLKFELEYLDGKIWNEKEYNAPKILLTTLKNRN